MRLHTSSEIEIAVLLQILPIGQAPLYVQNYCPDDYIYCGNAYKYCAFAANGMSRQLDMSNAGQNITIENASAFDALKPIRDLIQKADGWRRARFRLITLSPDFPDDPPQIVRTQGRNTKINGASIELSTGSPIEAVNARVVSSYITNQSVPELPRVNN